MSPCLGINPRVSIFHRPNESFSWVLFVCLFVCGYLHYVHYSITPFILLWCSYSSVGLASPVYSEQKHSKCIIPQLSSHLFMFHKWTVSLFTSLSVTFKQDALCRMDECVVGQTQTWPKKWKKIGWVIFHCVCVSRLLDPLLSMDIWVVSMFWLL